MTDNEEWHVDLPGEGSSAPVLGYTAAGTLSEVTRQTPGMRRREAISGGRFGATRLWMGENDVAGGVSSANHHHGDSETGIYVARGNPVFVFLRDGVEERIATAPGDYVFIPPFVPHREENPGPDAATVVLARTSQEAIVVNLPSLDAPIDIPTVSP